MRNLMSLPSSLALSCLYVTAAVLPSLASAQSPPLLSPAQIIQTDEYLYIGVEAENHINKDERWVTTTPGTPTEENDPDGNHSDQAGGSTYLELLPDMRVTHNDTFGPPTAYWNNGGEGPQADYTIDFPEPGRYYVHVRAFSTGTEDNGIHVGINDQWPQSGQKIQHCTSRLKAWAWASAQRDSGGNGSCGKEKTIWLDVPTAGTHTVSFSAREDGYELDRFALIKDLSGNTRVCEPSGLDNVSCKNGSIESPDGFVDMRVLLSAEIENADPEVEQPNPTEVMLDGVIELTARLENLDSFDTASNIVLTLSPVPGEWTMISMDDRCEEHDEKYLCELEEMEPTAPDENELFVFKMQANADGDIRIDASIAADELDDTPANDVTATIISVLKDLQDIDLSLAIDADATDYVTGDSVMLSVAISNLSDVGSEVVSFELTSPADLVLNAEALPNGCTADTTIQCSIDTINAEFTKTLNFEFIVEQAGEYSFNGSIFVENNDTDVSNDSANDTVLVADPIVIITTPEENTDSAEDTTSGSTDSSGNASEIEIPTVDISGEAEFSAEAGGSDGAQQSEDTDSNSDSGSMTYWFVLIMLMLCSARFYGWHQRELVAIKQ